MKSFDAALQGHLDSGATTMCYCWRVTRADGTVQGFTEHDRNVTFAGTTYLASSGFTASQLAQTKGLAVDNIDLDGALSSDTINEADLAAGEYDDADLELWWVNWTDTDQRTKVAKGNLGEVTRGQTGFEAEFRSIAHRMNQKSGRSYQRYCDANLGDSACKVDTSAPAYRGTGAITVAQGRSLTVTGLEGYAAGWFDSGVITFTSGENQDAIAEVKRFTRSGGVDKLELWFPPTSTVVSADTFTVVAGCGKDSETCRVKFSNIENFQGFPFMPGNDAMTSYPIQGDGADGRSLFD